MRKQQRETEWKSICEDLTAEHYKKLLSELSENCGDLSSFDSWEQAALYIQSLPADSPDKDKLLSNIFSEIRVKGITGYQSLILAVFWSDLIRIHSSKWKWDCNPDSRWGNVLWAYLQIAERFDPSARAYGICRKLFNDTVNSLYKIYKAEWAILEAEIPTDPQGILDTHDSFVFDNLQPSLTSSPTEIIRENLTYHLNSGHINELDLKIISETRLDGKTLKDCAEGSGISYQAAKKRRSRAENILRNINRDESKIVTNLSHPKKNIPFL